jgi:hypothetical protein
MARASRAMAWLQDRPRVLELAYLGFYRLALWAKPVLMIGGPKRLDRFMAPLEELPKRIMFDCRMCGQCVLHSTGMTCPMNCPKNLRNGPCGGVRADGHCEVVPEMPCVWVKAWERSRSMPTYGQEILLLQPPVNRSLEGTSAWVNLLTGVDRNVPPDWPSPPRAG